MNFSVVDIDWYNEAKPRNAVSGEVQLQLHRRTAEYISRLIREGRRCGEVLTRFDGELYSGFYVCMEEGEIPMPAPTLEERPAA